MNERIIERLSNPVCYPGNPDSVEVIQTHLSVVCIAGDDVYKLKKPIKLPFVDYSTAERREHFCHEELRLNKRLCPKIYRDVAPLFEGAGGVTFVNEGGTVVDHAVLMHRLPEERMLNELLACDEVSGDAITEVARIVAAFHRDAERGPEVLEAGNPEHLQQYALDNFSETRAMRGSIFDSDLHAQLEKQARKDFNVLLPEFKSRVAEGRVLEGHGDLHTRNICLSEPIAIYDCIEFSVGLRCGDVATENAFLAMDLIYRGHPELAARYLDAYIEASGDEGQRALIPTLIRYRAMVRAKVSAIAAGEVELPAADRNEASASAKRHLNLTAASAIAEKGPLLVVACGLPAAGKSYVFGELARETGWQCLSSDAIRKELAGVAATKKLPGKFYTQEFSRRTYAELFHRAAECQVSGPILLDANFRSASRRSEAQETARRAGAKLVIVWFDTDENVIRDRMKSRDLDATVNMSDADWSVYTKLKASFEPPCSGEAFELLTLDGVAGREENISRILSFLM